MRRNTKYFLTISICTGIFACTILTQDLIENLMIDGETLTCSMNEPFFRHEFNTGGTGAVKFDYAGNLGWQTTMLTRTSGSYDGTTGATSFVLSDGSTGSILPTPAACENDMSGEISDYTVSYTTFGTIPNQTVPRNGCCVKAPL